MHCIYGAPMGRDSDKTLDGTCSEPLYLCRVPFVDYDYDPGGAYWGGAYGGSLPLYVCATKDATRVRFLRARDRQHAWELLGKPRLIRPIT